MSRKMVRTMMASYRRRRLYRSDKEELILYTHFYIQSTDIRLPELSPSTTTAFGRGPPSPWALHGPGRLLVKACQSPGPSPAETIEKLEPESERKTCQAANLIY